MKKRIITISREFGSGGRTIGKMAADQLQIPCYDQELIEQISKESGFVQEYVAEKAEDSPHTGWFANAFSDRGFYGLSNQDYLWGIQRRIILELAQKGPCVIVGRCADYILKDQVDCLKVFIHADMAKRAERIVRLYGETQVPTEKRLKDKDKRRSSYYHIYTDMEWGKVQNYHITLDSGLLGIETCAEIIAGLY